MLVALYVDKAIKMNKKSNAKSMDASNWEEELEHLVFENIEIESESKSEHGRKERLYKTKLCTEITLAHEELNYFNKITNLKKKTKIYIIRLYYGYKQMVDLVRPILTHLVS